MNSESPEGVKLHHDGFPQAKACLLKRRAVTELKLGASTNCDASINLAASASQGASVKGGASTKSGASVKRTAGRRITLEATA